MGTVQANDEDETDGRHWVRQMNAALEPLGRPLELPLCAEVGEFDLPLDFIRLAVERDRASAERTEMQGRGCVFNHGVGRLFGERLADRMGKLLGRPGCVFENAFVWFYGRGDAMPTHTDRPRLDITMSVPLALDGVAAWPVALRQPNGEIVKWSSQVGTAFVFDGRWRPHWRLPLDGDAATVLLLHWRAPAVLWRGMLAPARAAQLAGNSAAPAPRTVLDRGSELARHAVPTSDVPTWSRHCDLLPELPVSPDGARLILPLRGELTAAVAGLAPVRLKPGDGLAFPSVERCELEWCAAPDQRLALVGAAEAPALESRPMS